VNMVEQKHGRAVSPTEPDSAVPRLVVGDDGSAAADVVWLWVNNHRWPGWRIAVVSARIPPVGPPVGAERATLHPWEPPHPRKLLSGDDVMVEQRAGFSDGAAAPTGYVSPGGFRSSRQGRPQRPQTSATENGAARLTPMDPLARTPRLRDSP
jgi:hypothetical protein